MPRPRKWTDDQLRDAVAQSTTMIEVLRRLELAPGGGSHIAVRGRIEELGLDTSHWYVCSRRRQEERLARRQQSSRRSKGGRRTWTDEQLAKAVADSKSIAGVLRALGLKVGGGAYVVIQERIEVLGLDRSHFTGQAWLQGRSNPHTTKRPLAEILVKNSDYTSTGHLKKRLLKEGLKSLVCEVCGLTEWRGEPIPLQLDHINGDRTDHRIENLRLVCPNCHAQTDTYCGRNIGRAASSVPGTMAERSPGGGIGETRAPQKGVPKRCEGSNPSPGTQLAIWPESGDRTA
jgi:hypothetical protein